MSNYNPRDILRTTYPVLLSAQTPAFSNGKSLSIPDTSFLANPERLPMLIDEIHFTPVLTNVAATLGFIQAIDFTGVSFTLGRLPITNGFVPLGVLGKSLNPQELNDGTGRVWRLPKPLYIPPGEILQPRFQYQLPAMPGGTILTDSASPFNIEISYIGRILPINYPKPKYIQAPWVSFWNSKFFRVDNQSSATTDASRETDLVNPFNSPLHLQRFNGRIVTATDDNVSGPNGGEADIRGASFIGSETTTLRMVSSYGSVLVRDFTSVYDLFHLYDKTWTVNTVMAPKTFFIVNLAAAATPTSFFAAPGLVSALGTIAQLQMALVGYRNVKLEEAQ